MLNTPRDIKIYLCTGCTDMHKGINGLSVLAQRLLSEAFACFTNVWIEASSPGLRVKIKEH